MNTHRIGYTLLLTLGCAVGCLILACSGGLEGGFRHAADDTVGLFRPNTLFKQYVVMPAEESPETDFADWKLTIHCQAARALDIVGVDTFRVTVETEYMPAVTDTIKARRVNLVTIDSLSVRLLSNDSVIIPVMVADSRERVASNPEIYYQHMLGPVFRYEEMIIPDQYGKIRLSYIAQVIDRQSGSVLDSRRITHDLVRIEVEKYHPTWYSPKSDPKVVSENQ